MKNFAKICFYASLVITAIGCFLGLLFFLKGDVLISGLFTVIMVAFQYVLVTKFVEHKELVRKNRMSFISVVLWVFYLLLVLPVSYFTLHAVNILIFEKAKIIESSEVLIKEIEQSNQHVTEIHEEYLAAKGKELELKLNDLLKGNSSIEAEVTKAPFNIPATTLEQLKKKEIFSADVKKMFNNERKGAFQKNSLDPKEFKDFENYKTKIRKWNLLQVSDALFQLDQYKTRSTAKCKKALAEEIQGADAAKYPFNPTFTPLYNPLPTPGKVLTQHLIPSLVWFLFLNLFMLAPFMLTQTVGGYRKKVDYYPGGRIITKP